LRQSLPRHASDVDFLAAVFEYAQRDDELLAQLEAIQRGKVDSATVLQTASTVASTPARVSVGSGGPGVHFCVWPVIYPRTRQQTLAYALALLLSDDRPYGHDLRRCQLPDCGRFFLVHRPPRGRPRESYCSNEHMEVAQLATASKRASESRARRIAREQRTRRPK